MDKMELYMYQAAILIAIVIICTVLVCICMHCCRRLRRKLAANDENEIDMDLELAEVSA